MKKYSQEDFKKLAFSLLEKTRNENVKKIVVGWVSRSYLEKELGKLSYIQICEHEITSEKDHNRWQERIQIIPVGEIVYYYDKTKEEFRNINDVINDLKNINDCQISVCVKIIKKMGDKKYLVKLFDRFFILKTNISLKYEINKKFKHEWFLVVDKERDIFPEFIEVNKDEVIAELI